MKILMGVKINLKVPVAVLSFMALMAPLPVMAQATEKKQADDKRQEIESIIRDYLLKNPAIIKEAMQAIEAR